MTLKPDTMQQEIFWRKEAVRYIEIMKVNKMYSPHALRISTAIMYKKQLIERAKNMPLEDLEAEVRDYEQRRKTPDKKGFIRQIIDELSGADKYEWDQYQANKKVLRVRKP